jgi:hypothetical protein
MNRKLFRWAGERGIVALGLTLALGLTACSQMTQPLSRDELAANLAPLLKIERRADQVKYYSLLLTNLGGIGAESVAIIKNHHDIYFVYYLAANLNLARGNIDSYLVHVRLAEKELDSMELILKEGFATLAQRNPQAEKDLSRLGL